MAKTPNLSGHGGGRAAWVTVHVPRDPQLADLLHGKGSRKTAHAIHQMRVAADPDANAHGTVTLPAAEAGPVVADLAGVLRRAREQDHPAAGTLADMMRDYLGHREGEPVAHAGY